MLWSIPLLLLVMLVTFALLRGMGGSPFRLEEGACRRRSRCSSRSTRRRVRAPGRGLPLPARAGPERPGGHLGNIAHDGFFSARPFVWVVPSAAIALFAVCVNFVADGAPDALDPRRGRARGRRGGPGVDRVARAVA
ncbi:MAG: hypothetical protein ACRDNE_05895 [Gaiellaceae bacterium]